MHSLRRFHNRVKRLVLEDAASSMPSPVIVDIGSGAGGDISKYISCKASYVLGVDVDEEAVSEAHRRLAKTIVPPGTSINFLCLKDTHAQLPFHLYPGRTDIISCQFALHFLWDKFTREFFQHLRNTLKPGGCFVGTVLNADALTALMRGEKVYEGRHLKAVLRQNYVEFELKGDTRFFQRPSLEKLMYPEEVISTFMENGFKLVYWRSFKDYADPGYSKDLLEVSSLYSAFRFMRR